MSEKQKKLLTTDQIKFFLLNGYLLLQPSSIPKDLHMTIYQKTMQLLNNEGNPGNNILPKISELGQIFKDPVIDGALLSLLGPNYQMMPHRFCHDNKPGQKEQNWHKDSFFGHKKPIRNHFPRYLMCMYYPRDVNLQLGNAPTAFVPQSQYTADIYNFRKNQNDKEFIKEKQQYAEVEGGSILLIHYDLIHKGTFNTSKNNTRLMFKFQFERLVEPCDERALKIMKEILIKENISEPIWNTYCDEKVPKLFAPVCLTMWNCLFNYTIDSNLIVKYDVETELKKLLQSNYINEDELCFAAYQLALQNELPTLFEKFNSSPKLVRFYVSFALAMARDVEGVASFLCKNITKVDKKILYLVLFIIFQAASNFSRCKEETKTLMLNTLVIVSEMNFLQTDEYCRLYLTEAIGTVLGVLKKDEIEKNEKQILKLIGYLKKMLSEEKDSQICFTSALSFARCSNALNCVKLSFDPIDYFSQIIDTTTNRYVRANTLMALKQLNTIEALEAYIRYLEDSRLCLFTNKKSQF
ncbi:hypothetical protein ABK040_013676 [Willaertia magna]